VNFSNTAKLDLFSLPPQCAACGFYLCSACDRKGLFRGGLEFPDASRKRQKWGTFVAMEGYYSLGSIAAPTARPGEFLEKSFLTLTR